MNPEQLELYAHLEKSVGSRSDYESDQDYFDQVEAVAIMILDSQWQEWPNDTLETYLSVYLEELRSKLNLV